MSIGTDYPTPVTVNGFSCKNCTDVGFAKKHIDPAHPKSGPYGIDAKNDPTVKNARSPAIIFGGGLDGADGKKTLTSAPVALNQIAPGQSAAASETAAAGSIFDISA